MNLFLLIRFLVLPTMDLRPCRNDLASHDASIWITRTRKPPLILVAAKRTELLAHIRGRPPPSLGRPDACH